MSSRRPSLIYEVCARFDELKAIGVSRHEEKKTVRADADAQGITISPLAVSTGRIHADKTLETYKAAALRYAHWARDTHGVGRLADLDAGAEQLVALYLEMRRDAGDSAYTLTTTRAALRMFYRPAYSPEEREARVRALGATVTLPRRRRATITRSRHAVAMDDAIVLERYIAIILSNPYPLREGQRPVFRPGEPYFGIDTSKLPPESVIYDNKPPGHVSVQNVTPEELQQAANETNIRGKCPK